MDQKHYSADEIGARVRSVRDSLFGPLSHSQREKLRAAFAAVPETRREAIRRDILRELTAQAGSDHTLAPLALGRVAHNPNQRPIVWMALEMVNLSLVNPQMFPAEHQSVLDLIGTTDSPYGMVVRCMEWMRVS